LPCSDCVGSNTAGDPIAGCIGGDAVRKVDAEGIRTAALYWGPALGPATFERLVRHFGSVAAALEAPVRELEDPALRLTAEQVAVIPTLGDRLGQYETEIEDLRNGNISVVFHWEPDYPALLRDLRSRPPVLCVGGRLLPEDDPAIAVVGTRSPTPEGREMARQLGAAFARAGTTVVSGMARGCDTAAHTGALDAGGRTIAVLGSGIRVLYPHENLDLARRVFSSGAVISEQEPRAQPTVGRLMARNRLQAALGRAVLVVESREQGGAMETAARAQEQGRLRYALKWRLPTDQSSGPQVLLQEGARAVAGPGDVDAIRLELLDHVARMQRVQKAHAGQRSLFDAEE